MPGNRFINLNLAENWRDYLLPASVLACLFIVFAPLPAAAMDGLLAANIAFSVVVLLTTLYVRSPLEFNIFPSLLLVTTVGRLSLNIATTRLILTKGAVDQELAAGQIIRSFGEFVAGDQIAVGLVIFAIIVIVQFIVITKGATRISEVAARFALDGMPGRQMSIDADLNSGAIDNETAVDRRKQLTRHADFFGAMDGASKFVRGDAIAGILITLVNIAGGLVVGLTSNMSLAESAGVFTKLTIGDGLVSQLPALFISIAAAMLVTRPTSESNLPRDTVKQFENYPAALFITGLFLCSLVFTSLPKVPLLGLAIVFFAAAYVSSRKTPSENKPHGRESGSVEHQASELTIDKLLGNENLEMELGLELIALADPDAGGTLLPNVTKIRKKLAADLGLVLPKIRVKDNLQLNPKEYRVLVQGNPVDIGTVFPGLCLAIDRGDALGPVQGAVATETTEYGQAFWIEPKFRESAESAGYQLSTSTQVLTMRLSEVTQQYAADLLTRDAVNDLVKEIQKSSPAIVDELIPDLLSLKELQTILKRLVAENVSIRPLGLILETIADTYEENAKQLIHVVESIRLKLAPQITSRCLGNNPVLKACTLDSALEHKIASATSIQNDRFVCDLDEEFLLAMKKALGNAADSMAGEQQLPLVCVAQDIRPWVSHYCRQQNIRLQVLGNREIVGTYVESIGEIAIDFSEPETAAA